MEVSAAGKPSGLRPIAALLMALAALIAAPATAAQNTDVARVSAIAKGAVVIQRGDEQSQQAAVVNAPVLPGDFLATEPGTQAEIQLDGFSMLRLGENVQARLVNNDSTLRKVQVAQGSVVLAVLHAQSGRCDIDTPSVTLRVSEVGDFHVTVAADGSTTATARTGKAEIVTPQRTYDLVPGTTLVAKGSAENPVISQAPEIGADALDEFASSRDRIANAALNTNTYVPASIAGYDDLNSYGRWVDVASYGMVWTPYAAANWAPYRYGSWVWADGFGWTWIASEPWGWTPFHYGRWFRCSPYGWCWYPPGYAFAPTWYPALVGFFGFGDYWDTIGFQYWGWVPLAPFELYYPWYPGWGAWHSHPRPPLPPPPTRRPKPIPPPRRQPVPPRKPLPPREPLPPTRMHPDYGSKVQTAYKNLRYGATGVDSTEFRQGNFTRTVPIDPRRLENITVLRGTLPLTPTTANLAFTHSKVARPVTFSPVFSQPRFRTAGLPQRTQFGSQRQEVRQTLHDQSRTIAPARPQNPPASEAWRRFESTRGTVKIPSVPQPRQYPVTTPIGVPRSPVSPPISTPRLPPVSTPRLPPVSPPHSPPVSRPPLPPSPPRSAPQPPSGHRPPKALS